MADPAFGALGTIASTAATQASSLTSTLTNVAVGDLVLAIAQRNLQANRAGCTCAGAAMALIKSVSANDGNGFGLDVYALKATSASSSASVVMSYTGTDLWGSLISARWTPGVLSATPNVSSCNTSGCSGLAASGTSRLAQSITTSARSLIIAAGTDWNDYRSHTAASGWTERADGSGSPVTSIQFIFDRVSNAGTFGGATAFSTTSSSDQYMSVMLAFAVDAQAASASFTGPQPASKFNHLLVR